MAAAIGMVSTQAQTIWPATPQRTAESRRVEPTPMIAPVIVCVVLTGMPNIEAPNRQTAAAVSAATGAPDALIVTTLGGVIFFLAQLSQTRSVILAQAPLVYLGEISYSV